MKRETKIGEESTRRFKIPRGIWQILTRALESLTNFHLNGLLLSKVYIVWAKKKYRGGIFHDTEEWYKIWRGIDVSFQNWHEEFDKFCPGTLESLQKLHFNGLFLTKVFVTFELKKYRGDMFDST